MNLIKASGARHGLVGETFGRTGRTGGIFKRRRSYGYVFQEKVQELAQAWKKNPCQRSGNYIFFEDRRRRSKILS